MNPETAASLDTAEPDGSGRAGRPRDIAPSEPLVELAEIDPSALHAIREQLGVHPLVAQTFARRGVCSAAAAREWLEDAEIADPGLIPGGLAAAAEIARHVAGGTRIAVHGDYDVDGVSSTAILVRALAGLGADVTWHVPSRFEDGYGLSAGSVRRLAADGAGLIVAVDCGIGSVDEVALASRLGVEVVICDHHTPGAVLPQAAIVHPALGDYPTPQLCAAATTHKLAALVVREAGGDPQAVDDDLALVALATVCDVVPLAGENRALVRAGLERLRRTQNPGLRELMRVAGVNQLAVDAGHLGFALGPRINAAGRMHSAEPAVELMLTTNPQRAAELAERLAKANHQRRETERGVTAAAEQQAAHQLDRFAIVVAGEGWHPGVLGIVAGRLAERHRRPVVALGIEDSVAAGSGRSGGVYDLHAGLTACSDLLTRYGGHRAAAGVALDAAGLDEFREALATHAAASLTPEDLRPRIRVDAVGQPADVNLDAVAALEALGPFGAENPAPRVLIADADLVSAVRLGGGPHFRLGVAAGGVRTSVVAFRQERAISAQPARAVDLVVELQRNEFNGRVEAQAVLGALLEHDADALRELWLAEFARALDEPAFAGATAGLDPALTVDRRGEPVTAILLELLAAERGTVALAVNDPVRWRAGLASLARVERRLGDVEVLAYDSIAPDRGALRDVVLAEPPPAPQLAAFEGAEISLAWSDATAVAVAARRSDLLVAREHVVAAFRTVRDASDPGAALLDELRAQLPGARVAGRALRVLGELSLVAIERSGPAVEAVVGLDAPRTDLGESVTFRSYSDYREESERWLRRLSVTPT
jgi:single-stranded-DNA-specific exonuclease